MMYPKKHTLNNNSNIKGRAGVHHPYFTTVAQMKDPQVELTIESISLPCLTPSPLLILHAPGTPFPLVSYPLLFTLPPSPALSSPTTFLCRETKTASSDFPLTLGLQY